MFGGQLISTRSHARTHDNRLLLINLDGWSDHVTEKPSMADRHDGFRFAPAFDRPVQIIADTVREHQGCF
jgi:hypothetical protein